MALTVPEKRDSLLAQAVQLLQVHVDAATIPAIYQTNRDDSHYGRTTRRDFAVIYGSPICYVAVRDPRNHRVLTRGVHEEIYASDTFTLIFLLAYTRGDTYAESSEESFDTAMYSSDQAAPGLLYWIENNSVLPDHGHGISILRIGQPRVSLRTLDLDKPKYVHSMETSIMIGS